MLRMLGYVDLAKRIEQGEFDEEADEEDKAMMAAELDEDLDEKQAKAMKKILGLL